MGTFVCKQLLKPTLQMAKLFLLVVFGILLQACASLPLPLNNTIIEPLITSQNAGHFGARPAIISPAQIHMIGPEQEAKFLIFMNSPTRSSMPAHMRLFSYLQTITDNFNYQGNTFTASEALLSNSGNCLSLAILTTALTQLANLDIGYQLIDEVPVFNYRGTVVEKGVHIRSIVYAPTTIKTAEKTGWFGKKGIKIDYFPNNRGRFIDNINHTDYIAMYYRNIAAEAINAEDYNTAFWYSLESLTYVPNHSAAINMLAVINRRSGNLAKAEELYLHGITYAEEKLSLLKNYRVLLMNSGRQQDAAAIAKQLLVLEDPSPFHWLQMARNANTEGNFTHAVRYFRRAIKLAPYLHEAHLGVAQAEYQLGRLKAAERALESALANVYTVSTKNLYKAKLATLTREIY